MGGKLPAQLDRVLAVADAQSKKVWHYKSEFYYKGTLNLTRRNVTYRLCDNESYYRKGGRKLFSEITGTLDRTYQFHYDYRVQYRFDAVQGTNTALDYNIEFFAVSIYDRYILRDHLLSPLNSKNTKYYKYTLTKDSAGVVSFSFKPRINNSQMLKGWFHFDKKKRYVSEIVFSGDDGVMAFSCHLLMGKEGESRFWPVRNDLTYRYRYYGNLFDGSCSFYQRYTEVDPHYNHPVSQYGKYDMTYLYSMDEDTTRSVTDSLQIARRRIVALTNDEKQIYDSCYSKYRFVEPSPAPKQNKDSIPADVRRKMVTKKFVEALGEAGEFLFRDFHFNVSNSTSIRLESPRFNYSGWRGFSLRESAEFTFTPTNGSGRRIAVRPLVGYNFRPKMFVWNIRTEYDYLPRHRGQFSVEAGTRGLENTLDRIHSKSGGDPLPGGEQDRSYVFLERSVELQHTAELFNGFDFMVGMVYHDRSPFDMPDMVIKYWKINKHYVSLASHFRVTYTPAQHFYFKNNRKEVIVSRLPTFCLDYERTVDGVMTVDSHYEKWEAMVTQNIPLDPFHQLMWKVGAGMFSNKENIDFVNYRYFNNGITDYSWMDELGGVFQLLDGKYYYNSPHYLRAHILMQSPSLLLGHFGTKFIRAERFYANGLMTEGLAPYIELGYGVSTALLDVGFFTSYIKREPFKAGLKFSFHLM